MSACTRCNSTDAAESWRELFDLLEVPVELPLGAGNDFCRHCAVNPELVTILNDLQGLIGAWVRLVHRADPGPAYREAAQHVDVLWRALLDEQAAELDQ